MAEVTFPAGGRATLDLRDCTGTIVLKDWDEPAIRIVAEGEAQPFVPRDGDVFRVRLDGGGTITMPTGLPADVLVPAAVQLRLMRVTRAGGETVVRPVTAEAARDTAEASETHERAAEGTPDIGEFARVMSERGRRIFEEMTRTLRASGAGISDDMAHRMEEAAERIDEQTRRLAERIQHEVERTMETTERVQHQARHAAARAEERARRAAERAAARAAHHAARHEERARRVAERVAQRAGGRAGRAGRGRWWFADRFDEWATHAAASPEGAPDHPGVPRAATAATREERLAILQMLREGKITSEQASKLLEALGG
ncbi:MAG: hypothetical protein HY332_08830 [Chloroflexi bacterium]|nr:hypothetical protein [Chloroflexota bacterium]